MKLDHIIAITIVDLDSILRLTIILVAGGLQSSSRPDMVDSTGKIFPLSVR
jgi:hypothetical protein